MCSEKVNFGSKVSPSTLGFLQVGMTWLFMVSDSVLLYNTLTSHPEIDVAQNTIQPYLNSLSDWTRENDLHLNPTKSSSTLFTPDPAEYNRTLSLTINNQVIPTCKNPKVHLLPKINLL